jgi:hypothetical protein
MKKIKKEEKEDRMKDREKRERTYMATILTCCVEMKRGWKE